MAPGPADHARLHRHRSVGLPRLSLPHGGAQPRAHLGRAVPQPHLDADLYRRLSGCVPASGSDPNVEPRGGGRLLPGAAGVGIPTVGARLPAAMAAQVAVDHHGGADDDQPGMVDPGAQHALDARRRSAVAAHLSGLVRRRHDADRAGGDGRALLCIRGHTVGGHLLLHRLHSDRGRAHDVAHSAGRGAGQDRLLCRDRRAGGGTAGLG